MTRIPVSLRHNALCLGDEDMTDEIVVYSFVFNRDGSITASCRINVYHPDGRSWGVFRDMRLPLQ